MARQRAKTVLVQARLPERLVQGLDRLVEEGWYRSRTDALEDAIRRLLMRFMARSEAGRLAARRLEGRLEDVDPLDIVLGEDARRDVVEAFGTDNVDEVIKVIRRR